MGQITVLLILSLSFLTFQNCAKTDDGDLASSYSANDASSSTAGNILDVVDFNWSDPGARNPDFTNYVLRRVKSFTINVEEQVVLDAKVFSEAEWTSTAVKEYFSVSVRIFVDGELCTNQKSHSTGTSKFMAVASACTRVLSVGEHTIDYQASAWTNVDTIGPEFYQGHLSYIIFSK